MGFAGSDNTRAGAVVFLTYGMYNVEIACFGNAAPGLEQRADAIAADQYARL